MRTPKIIQGQAFDWKEAEGYAKNAVDGEGNVNWMAASFADPGVMTCPKCGVYYWAEGNQVECLDCGHQWETANGKWLRERREKEMIRKAEEDGNVIYPT